LHESSQLKSVIGEPFEITLADGTRYAASNMKLDGKAAASNLQTNGMSSRVADQFGGRKLELPLRSAYGRLRVFWRAILHDGVNYLREEIEAAPNLGGAVHQTLRHPNILKMSILSLSWKFARENTFSFGFQVQAIPCLPAERIPSDGRSLLKEEWSVKV
jgi:hypothetical protein